MIASTANTNRIWPNWWRLGGIDGIIWAILFYQENQELTPAFYVGVLIILFAIFLNSYLRGWSERRKQPVVE